jgi:hypothetical protein
MTKKPTTKEERVVKRAKKRLARAQQGRETMLYNVLYNGWPVAELRKAHEEYAVASHHLYDAQEANYAATKREAEADTPAIARHAAAEVPAVEREAGSNVVLFDPTRRRKPDPTLL